MKNLSKIIAASIFLVFGLFTAITLFPNPLSALPSTNPPSGDIIPTFSGLNVTGDTDLRGNIENTGKIYVAGIYIGERSVYINDNLATSGDITVAGKIKAESVGRYYKVFDTVNVGKSTSPQSASSICTTGDILTGCLGNVIQVEAGDIFLGSQNPMSALTTSVEARTCNAWHLNAGGGTADTDSLQATAICFSPN
ncbi:hypothetical protein C0416_05115 [bacterium]|nr:hypothetical protein [bacterium]